MEVPLFASRPSLEPLLDQVAARQRAVLEGGKPILGPEVEAFESEFAAWIGAEHCVGVSSRTDALAVALRALGVGPGDEVVVPSLSFFATVEPVVTIGATPAFCDVDPETWVMTAAAAEPAITDRTKALLPVHIFGNPAPVGELMELAAPRGIKVLEDAAQAHGARLGGRMAGALGDAATFSFFPSKNLGGLGRRRRRQLRPRGRGDRAAVALPWLRGQRTYTDAGYNSRLDEMQAAGLRVLLPHMDEWTAARRGEGLRRRRPGPHVTTQAETREARAAGICSWSARPSATASPSGCRPPASARAYYETPLYAQPAVSRWAPAEPLPATEAICAEILALPMGTALDPKALAAVTDAVREALGVEA